MSDISDSTSALRVSAESLRNGGIFASEVAAHLDTARALDFGAMDRASSDRHSLVWPAVLSNLLLTQSSENPLTVTFPRTDAARLVLFRAGFPFSLQRRANPVSAEDIDGVEKGQHFDAWLRLWSEPWQPGSPGPELTLFDDTPRVVDSKQWSADSGMIQNQSNAKNAITVIIDPHRWPKEVVRRQASQGMAAGWIAGVTPGSNNADLVASRKVWRGLITRKVLTEVLDNISDHAFTRPHGVEPIAERDAATIVVLSRTDGGGHESHPRLRVVVADNGYGAITTLRPKLRNSENPDDRARAALGADELLGHLLRQRAKSATDPGLTWAVTGFHTAVAEVTAAHQIKSTEPNVTDAELTLVTNDDEHGGAVVATVRPGNSIPEVSVHPKVGVRGTIVVVTVPMPHAGHATMTSGDDLALTSSSK